MKIARIEASSLIEWPGKISLLVYTIGCGMRCPFCYNAELVLPDKHPVAVSEEGVLKTIRQRRSFIDAVAITGGDPLMQPDIEDFVLKIKSMGLMVKLDTNGIFDNKLAMLLARRMVDYVAMDYKAPQSKYGLYTGISVDISHIINSLKNIIRHAPDYEIRTTVAPGLTKNDLYDIADELSAIGVKKYYLQRFVVPKGAHFVNPEWKRKRGLSIRDIKDVWGEIKMMFEGGGVRG